MGLLSKSSIIEAINSRHPITFKYLEEDGSFTRRVGNPHVLYLLKSDNSLRLDLYQTGGDSKSVRLRKATLPKWSCYFFVDKIDNVLIDRTSTFNIDKDYNRSSDRYDKDIAKV